MSLLPNARLGGVQMASSWQLLGLPDQYADSSAAGQPQFPEEGLKLIVFDV
jgi:hypothetical protein